MGIIKRMSAGPIFTGGKAAGLQLTLYEMVAQVDN